MTQQAPNKAPQWQMGKLQIHSANEGIKQISDASPGLLWGTIVPQHDRFADRFPTPASPAEPYYMRLHPIQRQPPSAAAASCTPVKEGIYYRLATVW